MSSGSAGICTTLDSGFRRVETISADRSVGVASATDFVVAACGRFSFRSGPRGPCLNARGGRYPRERFRVVGHLQTNKVRKVIEGFALFHGVDNTALALQMNRIAGEFGVTASILLEVNVSGEESKFGFTPTSLPAALEELIPLPHLRIEGLMTMAQFSENPESARPVFEGLRKLRDALSAASGHPLKELSMGMSGDFEQGIAEGATIVRIGSAIFGSRSMQPTPQIQLSEVPTT